MATSKQVIGEFVKALSVKQPTPGGGAAAAVGAAVGGAAASMAAAYTQRKKDRESGAAEKATALIDSIDLGSLLAAADDDAAAYADLQRTWKDTAMTAEEKAKIEATAKGADDALMLDEHGHLAETNATHVFVVSGGVVETSDTSACPEGITRSVVLELCAVAVHLLADLERHCTAVRTVLLKGVDDVVACRSRVGQTNDGLQVE